VSRIGKTIQSIPSSAKIAFLIMILSRILVFAVGYAVTYFNGGPASPFEAVLGMFNRWDAPHYVAIARNWYATDPSLDAYNFIVFFPLYPILIRLFALNLDYINLSALAVSNVFSIVAFLYLYKLASLEYDEGVAVKAVLFLAVFPTAYFFAAPYGEGVFFALTIASIYYARLGKWHFSGLLSFLAALTRIFGLLLFPVLLVEYLHQRDWKPRKAQLSIVWTLLALAGFLIYLGINYTVTGNAFTFMTIEAIHWGTMLDPFSGLNAAFSWATTASYPDNLTVGVAPIAFAIFGLLMIVASIPRRQRPVYIVYMFLSWALAISTSWWISVPRYIMAMFPMFMLLGLMSKKRSFVIAWTIGSGVLLCYFSGLFARGWWAF
jgi:hypothetical protein